MPARVTIDQHRIAHVDGKPFFPIGARHMPEGATPALLRDVGFNAYRALAFGHESGEPEDIPDDLEGIYFWSYLYNRADFSRSPDHQSQLRRRIEQLRDHPALLCYENLNEPTLFYPGDRLKAEPEDLAVGTDLVRDLDPHHPIWLAHSCTNTIATLRRFDACLDIVGANPYPVHVPGMRPHIGVRPDGRILDCPDQSVHAAGKYTEKMMQVGGGRRPVWMILQALANEHWYNPVHTPAMAGRGIDASKVIYPTCAQMRFMTFDAIVHGATGIALGMWRTPVEGEIWRDITRLVGELRDLHDALCAPLVVEDIAVSHGDLGFTVWDGVRVLARRLRDVLYLFAVNTQFDPAEVTVRLASLDRASRAAVVGEEREVAVERGAMGDRFEPYEAHVYRIQVP